MARYAVGDVHGCLQTLQALLDAIGPGSGDTLLFLGDYIDRGPDSKGVIDLLMALPHSGVETICLKGNHEVLMLDAFHAAAPTALERWVKNGGAETLASFGLTTQTLQHLPGEYLQWVEQLPILHQDGDFLCVHAGLDLKAANPLAPNETSMLWIRNWLDEAEMLRRLPGLTVLHGHTPQPRWVLEQTLADKRPALDLDTGCVYPDRDPDMGWLSAFNLDSGMLHSVRYQER
jgi:serine/threonine protein phosphatase 1